MNVDGIEKLMLRRETGDLTDVEYLDASKLAITNLKPNSPDEEAEKSALLAHIEELRVRALYWQNREIEELAGQVEDWLMEPHIQQP